MRRKLIKKVLIGLGILIVLIIASVLAVIIYFAKDAPELNSAKDLAVFIKNNPERASIYYVKNGVAAADLNSDAAFPLASTVKTIIAIEYAKQIGQGKIDPQERIDLSELEKYYYGLDGGAHPAWVKDFTEKGLIADDKTTLANVAKGMIWFSSNANTEFLLDKLGLENVNRNLSELGLERHDKLYYFTSAALLLDRLSERELAAMPLDEYIVKSAELHEQAKTGAVNKNEASSISRTWNALTSNSQKIWSDRLPASTTKEYASIMKKINDRDFFDEKTQAALDDVMQVYMQNPQNREIFNHYGGKGGSTSYVLTKAVYATDKNGNKTELCFFFNNLKLAESLALQDYLRDFEKMMLTDGQFQKEVLEILNAK